MKPSIAPKKKGIPRELSDLWHENVRSIMDILHIRQEDLAKECDLSRQSISNMFTREDRHLTKIQFLGTMQVLRNMIDGTTMDRGRKDLAMAYWNNLNDAYRKI